MTLPRFSLRLLFVAVAVVALCAWLAWERSFVGRRRSAEAMLRADPAFKVRTVDELLSFLGRNVDRDRAKFASIPFVRVLMGDVPMQAIGYREADADQERVELAKRLFPEAMVRPLAPRPSPAPPPTP
jgi:hypothetical protein